VGECHRILAGGFKVPKDRRLKLVNLLTGVL